MAQLALTAAGYYFGGPIGAAVGSYLGARYELSKQKFEGPRLTDAQVIGTAYGEPIPWCIGSVRVAGQVWWASARRETATTEEAGKGGGPEVTTFTYQQDLLLGLVGRESAGIARIWMNGKVIWTRLASSSIQSVANSDGSNLFSRLTVYTGSADQLPDPTYEAAVTDAPAYRGRTTVFIEGLQLGQSGQLPNLMFEVVTDATFSIGTAVAGATVTSPAGFNAGTAAASEGTVFRVAIGQWTSTYATNNVNVYDIDTVSQDATLVGSFSVSVPSTSPAIGNSDVPVFHQTTATVSTSYNSVGAATTYNFTSPAASDNSNARFARRGTALVSKCNTQVVRHNVGGGAVQATSANLGVTVASIEIIGSNVYVAGSGGGKQVFRLDLSTLTLQETINRPAASSGSIAGTSPFLFDFNGELGLLEPATTSLFYIYRSGAWVLQGTIDNAFIFENGVDASGSIGVVGGLVVGGFFRDALTPYRTWAAPITTTPGNATLQETVEALCERAGMPADTYDATELASVTKPVRSLLVGQVEGTRGAIQQLQTAFFFECSLSDKLYFRPRATASVATVPFSDLAAGNDNADGEPFALTQASDLELPPQVSVRYRNVSADYQAGSEHSDRLLSGQVAQQVIEIGIGLTPAEAKGVADVLMVDSLAQLLTGSISLPLRYAKLESADPVNVVDDDGTAYRIRLGRKMDAACVLKFDFTRDDASAITSAEITDDGYTPVIEVSKPSDTLIEPMDIPLLRDADDSAGYYVAAKGETTIWPGAQVLTSTNDVDYTTAANVAESAVFGTCTTTLGSYTGVGFDEAHTLTVNVGYGELSSTTRDEIIADGSINALLVGSEVINFVTATLGSTNPNIYTLSGLLRGRRGTESFISTHSASETVVLLRTIGLRRVTTQLSDINQVRYLKGVTSGAPVSSAVAETFTNTGLYAKPFAVANLRALTEESGLVSCSWDRRTRYSTLWPTTADVPLGEASEAYEVELLTPADAVVSTTSVSTNSLTISAAGLSESLPVAAAGMTLISGTYYGVDVEGNTNSTLRRLVAQTSAGISQQSPYLGAELIEVVYTATDAYTAAFYMTNGVPAAYSDTFVQRFLLSDITAAAATYTASVAGDVYGIAHDGTDLWIIESSTPRLRRLDGTALTVSATHALTGPVEMGLAFSSGRLFFGDDGDLVAWETTGSPTIAWRTALPASYGFIKSIVCADANVFVSTLAGVYVYSRASGSLVATTGLVAYAYNGSRQSMHVFGSDVAIYVGPASTQPFVILDGATGAVSSRFSADAVGLLGADSTLVWAAGQSASTIVGADIAEGYEPIGGSLSGYKVRVYQMSATYGRGYPTTTTI